MICVLVALTGLAAVAVFAAGRSDADSPWAAWAACAVLRILAAPLLAGLFLVCALTSPHRGPRLALTIAVVLEAAATAYGGLIWFVPLLLQRVTRVA
jgi:hypothetical protein